MYSYRVVHESTRGSTYDPARFCNSLSQLAHRRDADFNTKSPRSLTPEGHHGCQAQVLPIRCGGHVAVSPKTKTTKTTRDTNVIYMPYLVSCTDSTLDSPPNKCHSTAWVGAALVQVAR